MLAQIKHLRPTATEDDFILRDDADGKGPYFSYWNGALGAPPTMSELAGAKLQTDLDEEQQTKSDLAKLKIAELFTKIMPDTLNFLAALPGAPQSIKDAAIIATAEKAKIK